MSRRPMVLKVCDQYAQNMELDVDLGTLDVHVGDEVLCFDKHNAISIVEYIQERLFNGEIK